MSKILVIDDSKTTRHVLNTSLKSYGHDIISAVDGEEGIAMVQKERPDLILLDIHMPKMDGFETCRIIKKNHNLKDIPILFMTGHYKSVQDAVKGFELGACDYIRKPFEIDELLARVEVMLKIKVQQDTIKELSLTDDLTGLYNRRMMHIRLKENLALAKRHDCPLSCMMIDIDHFKNVNDTYGHLFGDYVIVEVAKILKSFTRTEDLLIRYGGEEFLLVIHETLAKVYVLAERLRKTIEAYSYTMNEHSISLKVSIGITKYMDNVTDTEEKIIALADSALYYAKYSGRNRVICFPDEGVPQIKNMKMMKHHLKKHNPKSVLQKTSIHLNFSEKQIQTTGQKAL